MPTRNQRFFCGDQRALVGKLSDSRLACANLAKRPMLPGTLYYAAIYRAAGWQAGQK